MLVHQRVTLFPQGGTEQARGPFPKIAVQVAVLRCLCTRLHGPGSKSASWKTKIQQCCELTCDLTSCSLVKGCHDCHYYSKCCEVVPKQNGDKKARLNIEQHCLSQLFGVLAMSRVVFRQIHPQLRCILYDPVRLVLGLEYYLVITTLIQYRCRGQNGRLCYES